MFEIILEITRIEDESDRAFLEGLFIKYEKQLKWSAMQILKNEIDAEDTE